MNLVQLAIQRPIAVIAAVLMTVLFGVLALSSIPIQLTPDVNRPVISINTSWPGAAPAEIEREIINRQEEQMAGLEDLSQITSEASLGQARISLQFKVDSNMDKILLLVANRLDRVAGYPDEVNQPVLSTAGSEASPIAWFIVNRQAGNDRPIHEFGDFLKDVVKDRIERVAGVSQVNVFGGTAEEIHIKVEPHRLAEYGLTISHVTSILRQANASVSAGDVAEGKRKYVVRMEGQLDTLDKIRNVVLRSVGDQGNDSFGRVTLGDIAEVEYGHKEAGARIRMNGQPSLAMNAVRETGANVIETMNGVKAAVAELNAQALPDSGLVLRQVYDETIYINSAIDLVQKNIWIGGTLAALVLLIFLRSMRATLIVSIAIPVSVVGAFVAMAALGRSINVVSLAGLAFAIGMVVDAAIVVMENIYRLREQGKSTTEAALQGTRQVWGAVLVSVMTTVMVFVPILMMELEIGQLFRDIAVAISVSVILSLIVSATVIPAMAQWLLGMGKSGRTGKSWRMPLPIIDGFARFFVNWTTASIKRIVSSWSFSLAVVIVVTVVAGYVSITLLPKLEYLPEGDRNLVFGIIIPPPGYNLDTMDSIATEVEQAIKPHWVSESGPVSAPGEPPKIENFFFVATGGRTFLGAVSADSQRAAELIPVLRKPVFREPGTFGFISQPSIFGQGIGGGRKIDFDISGPDLETILGVAGRALIKVFTVLPREQGTQLRPNPGLEFGAPEVRVFPDRMRLADNGVSARELGDTVDAFNDGKRVAEVTIGNRIVDLVLRGNSDSMEQTQAIGNLPVVTSSGNILPVNLLADVVMTSGPVAIRHRERLRTVSLEIRPPPHIPLEVAMDTIKTDVIAALQSEGVPPGIKLGLSGTADELDKTWEAMQIQLLLAVIIVTLVLAVLFESFIYPLVILLAVPVAAAGGVVGLWMLNLYYQQSLDMLTLLGFVILVGIVVNNAILLVHQTLYYVRQGEQEVIEAIIQATRDRIRPIFMSTLTSVCGMLPLVLFPGAGSELYRGLGSVVVGGLAFSAVLTLLIVPPMLAILVAPLERRRMRIEKLRAAMEH